MIIWSGFGFLPVVFLIFFAFAFSVEGNGPLSGGSFACTFFLTGLASGALGWWFRRRPARIVIDKATGKEIALRRSHSLFFVPVIYWGPIFVAMGLYELIHAAAKP